MAGGQRTGRPVCGPLQGPPGRARTGPGRKFPFGEARAIPLRSSPHAPSHNRSGKMGLPTEYAFRPGGSAGGPQRHSVNQPKIVELKINNLFQRFSWCRLQESNPRPTDYK